MFFEETKQIPPDPIFGLVEAFRKDPHTKKVNLLVGIYKDEHLKAELFPSAKRAKEAIFSQDLSADYLPIDGLEEFSDLLGELLFSKALWSGFKDRIYAAQAPGGTGALRVLADVLHEEIGPSLYLPNHTWPNHPNVFQKSGYQVSTYPYYSPESRGFDVQKTIHFLQTLSEKSIILLHGCCHNPTGSDPTEQEWRALSRVIQEKKLFPFFDIAYQGLGEDVEKDAAAIRLFLQEGHEMAVAYSCSKNFSMYCQRVGALFVVSKEKKFKPAIASQAKKVIRSLYSNPPAHGARIVSQILKDPPTFKLWLKDLEHVRNRIRKTRASLIDRLQKGSKEDFLYLKNHRGMFSFIDLSPEQVDRLRLEFSVYMTRDGRLSISGLNEENLDDVANSLLTVCAKT